MIPEQIYSVVVVAALVVTLTVLGHRAGRRR